MECCSVVGRNASVDFLPVADNFFAEYRNNSAGAILQSYPGCLRLRTRYATGCAQNLQRLAGNGISERHSPQVLVVGAAGFLIFARR